MAYHVETVERDDNDNLKFTTIGDFPNITAAISVAKKTAKTRSDCRKAGPSSIAYIGNKITAYITW